MKALLLVGGAAQASHPNMQALYTLADAYTGLGDVEVAVVWGARLSRDARNEHYKQSAASYKQSAEVWQRVPEVGRVSPDGFDCVPPAAVERRRSQAEANVQKVWGASP